MLNEIGLDSYLPHRLLSGEARMPNQKYRFSSLLFLDHQLLLVNNWPMQILIRVGSLA